jgi:hypothetical protein
MPGWAGVDPALPAAVSELGFGAMRGRALALYALLPAAIAACGGGGPPIEPTVDAEAPDARLDARHVEPWLRAGTIARSTEAVPGPGFNTTIQAMAWDGEHYVYLDMAQQVTVVAADGTVVHRKYYPAFGRQLACRPDHVCAIPTDESTGNWLRILSTADPSPIVPAPILLSKPLPSSELIIGALTDGFLVIDSASNQFFRVTDAGAVTDGVLTAPGTATALACAGDGCTVITTCTPDDPCTGIYAFRLHAGGLESAPIALPLGTADAIACRGDGCLVVGRTSNQVRGVRTSRYGVPAEAAFTVVTANGMTEDLHVAADATSYVAAYVRVFSTDPMDPDVEQNHLAVRVGFDAGGPVGAAIPWAYAPYDVSRCPIACAPAGCAAGAINGYRNLIGDAVDPAPIRFTATNTQRGAFLYGVDAIDVAWIDTRYDGGPAVRTAAWTDAAGLAPSTTIPTQFGSPRVAMWSGGYQLLLYDSVIDRLTAAGDVAGSTSLPRRYLDLACHGDTCLAVGEDSRIRLRLDGSVVAGSLQSTPTAAFVGIEAFGDTARFATVYQDQVDNTQVAFLEPDGTVRDTEWVTDVVSMAPMPATAPVPMVALGDRVLMAWHDHDRVVVRGFDADGSYAGALELGAVPPELVVWIGMVVVDGRAVVAWVDQTGAELGATVVDRDLRQVGDPIAVPLPFPHAAIGRLDLRALGTTVLVAWDALDWTAATSRLTVLPLYVRP